MWVLTDRWKPGYCDYHRHPGEAKIEVQGWIRLHEVDDAHVRPPRGLRRLLGYLAAYGPVQTLRKVRSRLRERGRNRKFSSWGWGVVEDVGPDSRFQPGERVVFLAPLHPACVNRVSLDERLIRPAGRGARLPPEEPRVVLEGVAGKVPGGVSSIVGWSRFSGKSLSVAEVDVVLDRLGGAFAEQETSRLRRLEWGPEAERDSGRAPDSGGRGRSAVLFGLGHYAKNMLMSRISRHVDVTCIHEIDPLQLGPGVDSSVDHRTSAFPAPDERYGVFLVAGYHHTHAPIAIHALEQGADVVVEKPVVTTAQQLDELVTAMEASPGRLFAAFQRRYSRFNDHLAEDLELQRGTPVHCHCSVYEIPLPANHWYRWPNSGTRVVSNGCHWIDHFLYLNDFAEPGYVEGRVLANGDVLVIVELDNAAAFSMTITEHGSGRLGMRDHVEFRARDRTVAITDQRFYRSESTGAVLRRDRMPAGRPYDQMYRAIGRRLQSTGPGDSTLSVRVSAEVMLAADEQVGAALTRSD